MAKKSETKKLSMFSQAFVRAISGIVVENLTDEEGACVPVSAVARALRKQRLFGEGNLQLLTVAVSRAVHNGDVPGFASRRGPGGGIYRLAPKASPKRASKADAPAAAVSTELAVAAEPMPA